MFLLQLDKRRIELEKSRIELENKRVQLEKNSLQHKITIETKAPIIFSCVVLSRLAYFSSNHFLALYLNIFGPIIKKEELEKIAGVKFSDKNILKNEDELSDAPMTGRSQIFTQGTTLKEAAKAINSKVQESVASGNKKSGDFKNNKVFEKIGDNYKVAYISISTSNYAGYYILVDTRMPKSIFIIFRGTYSVKSTRAYTRPSSIIPYYDKEEKGKGKEFAVLRGIAKLVIDVYHSIIESMVYLSTKYNENCSDIKVFTTGHSLGGGLATLFANRWAGFQNEVQKGSSLYSKDNYDIFNETICCVAIASPRVFNKKLAADFCTRINEGKIIYVRLRTRGDPVPALPSDIFGFAHPCSSEEDTPNTISIVGKYPLRRNFKWGPYDYYDTPQNWEKTGTQIALSNAMSHTNYYYINFLNSVDLRAFIDEVKNPTCSIVDGFCPIVARFIKGVAHSNQEAASSSFEFKQIFIKLSEFRRKKGTGDNVFFDTLMNRKNFNKLIHKMNTITDKDCYNNTTPEEGEIQKSNEITLDSSEKPIIPISIPEHEDQAGGRRTKNAYRKRLKERKKGDKQTRRKQTRRKQTKRE